MECKKVFIVGQPNISVIELKAKFSIPDSTEIIVVNDQKELDEILNTDASVLFPKNEPFVITPMERYIGFEPKLKHLPKGHERPYKFHR